MSLAEQRRHLREQALALPADPPPPPWIQSCSIHAGGITVAGWTRAEHILLVSNEGYSLTNSDTGERLERNRDEKATNAALSTTQLTFTLPSNGEVTPIFGLFGGGGIRGTADSWWLETIAPDWPEEMVLLFDPSAAEPGASRFGYFYGAHRLHLPGLGGELRGCGFAPSGLRFMVVASDGAFVYRWQ
jgi:hypothetical protein